MQTLSDRDQINNTIQKLFLYLGEKEWTKLQDEVFTDLLELDLSSFGNEPEPRSSKSFCDELEYRFRELDSVSYTLGPVVIEQEQDEAEVLMTAETTQYKESKKKENLRKYYGKYKLKLQRTDMVWRVSRFLFEIKFVSGNPGLNQK